ncbi:MAG: ATP-dependent Clp protease ATP-binding subunit [Oscillospiraceae bacterium]|nr:ATP-dependent Clp protease ATP-binding subunit [Oscillospiraceae bacterium]
MLASYCSKCKEYPAVIFITKYENGKTTNDGICLKCAREMNITPVQNLIRKMGLTDEDLETLTEDMMEAMGGLESLMEEFEGSDHDENSEDGKTATLPFLSRLFGSPEDMSPNSPSQQGPGQRNMGPGGIIGPGTGPGSKPNEQGNSEEKGGPGRRGGKRRKHLESFCISLSKKAAEDKLDRIVGRETETERVVQILNRRQKNNPCLIGEPGVGKTAIAEGLSQRIHDGDVPQKLRNKEVYLLDLTALVAGTQFRGQFESRMKGLVEEIKTQGNVILVIDEVHTLVGAGDAEGSMSAANILKPALSRGEIQVIGATTLNEYRKHIEKDAALERRFQPVVVDEPSISESIEIIIGIKSYYEGFHGVSITDEIARQAVLLSERYISDRFLPDKAIDLIDEACSDMNLKSEFIAKKEALYKEKADIEKEREMILSSQDEKDYARLAELRSLDYRLTDELNILELEGNPALTIDNLARVIELWTKIPASNIREDEFKRLSELETRLKQFIIGQDDAINSVCAAIKRNRVGITSKRKPVSFIFIGSTGVGKTELVKRLAMDMFDSPESLVRLDMSEFMEKHAVSRIIGSPPGYIGYDEAGQLTEKIRRRPYSVVLFDEIEKAHPDVMNILLQILDDGHITDAHGRNINFENTIIIMTTNAGSDRKDGSVGFNRTSDEQGKEKSEKALKDFLRPEFLNRIDEIVYFNQLTEDDFKKIARIMLGELRDVMAEKPIELRYDERLIDYLTAKSFSQAYGARNLRRIIQKEIEDLIATEMISNYESPITQVDLSVLEEQMRIQAM